MSSKGFKQTQEHKNKIGKSNKGIHLNKTNSGVLILIFSFLTQRVYTLWD